MSAARFFTQSKDVENASTQIIKLNDAIRHSAGVEQQKLVADLAKTIEGIDFPSLIKLSEVKPEIDSICKLPCLDQHWAHSLKTLAPSKPAKAVPDFKYQPIPTLHTFDMLKGLYSYNQFIEMTQKSEAQEFKLDQAEYHLRRSAQYGCFSALNALCIEGLALFKGGNGSLAKAQEIIQYAEMAAHLYWTPGCYLLANVYQELSQYTKLLLDDNNQSLKKIYFSEAYKALCIAEKLHSDSATMIHNAYRGKTIWEATNNRFTSWAAAKNYLEKCSGGLLELSDMKMASKSVDIALVLPFEINDDKDSYKKFERL